MRSKNVRFYEKAWVTKLNEKVGELESDWQIDIIIRRIIRHKTIL